MEHDEKMESHRTDIATLQPQFFIATKELALNGVSDRLLELADDIEFAGRCACIELYRSGLEEDLRLIRHVVDNVYRVIVSQPVYEDVIQRLEQIDLRLHAIARKDENWKYTTPVQWQIGCVSTDAKPTNPRIPMLDTMIEDYVENRMIGCEELHKLPPSDIVRMMAGRDVKASIRSSSIVNQEVLRVEVEDISLKHPTRLGDFLVNQVSFHVREGEVLGIFGRMGAGRTELLECLFGLHSKTSTGNVFINGREVLVDCPSDAISHGLALVPQDRKHDGLVLSMTVGENASLASLHRSERFGFLNGRAERESVQPFVERFRVKTPSLRERIQNLSGGNQQKVILAKWLATGPTVLMLDEPTRGIDVQAKNEIYELINELTAEGLAIVVVSSELPEVMTVSDRILVLCEGRATEEFDREHATVDAIMHAALPRGTVTA